MEGGAQRQRIAEVPEIDFLQPGRGVTFFNYAALVKYNRITKVEDLFCRRHFGNAMLAVVLSFWHDISWLYL